MARRRSTYSVRINSTQATPIAGAVETGPDGKVIGLLEIESLAAVKIEISHDPHPMFRYGDGIRLAAASAAGEVGGSYSQEQSPDPFEWWAIAESGSGHDVRVHDSRRPSLGGR